MINLLIYFLNRAKKFLLFLAAVNNLWKIVHMLPPGFHNEKLKTLEQHVNSLLFLLEHSNNHEIQ